MDDRSEKEQKKKKKEKPEWRSAAEAYSRGDEGAESRVREIGPEHQANAMALLCRKMSKNSVLSPADADNLMKVLPNAPRQFGFAIGAAMLGGRDNDLAKKYLVESLGALEHEELHPSLAKGVAPAKRLLVLGAIVEKPLSESISGALLDATASWLGEATQEGSWPKSDQEISKLNELLLSGFRDALTTKKSESFWRAYIKFIHPKSLLDSQEWRGLIAEIASSDQKGSLSTAVRSTISSYLQELNEAKTHTESEGSEQRTIMQQSSPTRANPEQPIHHGSSTAESIEERPGYLARLRAGHTSLEKLVSVLEEAQQEHKQYQSVRKDYERSQRDIESYRKSEVELATECEALKTRLEVLEIKLRAQDKQRSQLDEALRSARAEVSRFRDQLVARDADLARSANKIIDLDKKLAAAYLETKRAHNERDVAVEQEKSIRIDRDRIALEHDRNLEAEKRLTTEGVVAELRNRIANVISLQWESAYRLASNPDARETLEQLKRRLLDITRGI